MRYQVDSEAVLGATAAVRSTIGRVQSEVGALHGQLDGLQGAWSGQAASAFQSLIAEWRATQQRVEENLTAISHALGQAGQHYAETELSNARLFG
ncbi:MAG TPA: WXG100 family type VII secretion target [Lacisediminihabitans sp.]|uniref:WXG100 family type VII secretion target n=1 Tax=Lacisediminihabitans sp. TaxID=2787631 RepID=UPI002ED9C0E6